MWMRSGRSATAHAARKSWHWTRKASACVWISASTSRNPDASPCDRRSRRRLLQKAIRLSYDYLLVTVVRWRSCRSLWVCLRGWCRRTRHPHQQAHHEGHGHLQADGGRSWYEQRGKQPVDKDAIRGCVHVPLRLDHVRAEPQKRQREQRDVVNDHM